MQRCRGAGAEVQISRWGGYAEEEWWCRGCAEELHTCRCRGVEVYMCRGAEVQESFRGAEVQESGSLHRCTGAEVQVVQW